MFACVIGFQGGGWGKGTKTEGRVTLPHPLKEWLQKVIFKKSPRVLSSYTE